MMPTVGSYIISRLIFGKGKILKISPANIAYSENQYTVQWPDKQRNHLESFITTCVIVENPNDILKEIL